MDFQHALPQQEQSAGKQNEIAPRHALIADVEQRLNEPREPDDREQQRDPRQHGESEARDACRSLSGFR